MIRIYTLTDPRTNKIFYVGASKRSDIEIVCRHVGGNSYRGTRKELRQLGLKPVLETIETADDVIQADFLETYWIWQFRSWGFTTENKMLFSGYIKYA